MLVNEKRKITCKMSIYCTVYIVKYRTILSSERMLHRDYNRKCSVDKIELLVVGLKGLSPRRTDWR
jgi:hypothetical protein